MNFSKSCLLCALFFAATSSLARLDTLWTRVIDMDGVSTFYGGTECANGDFVLVGSIDSGSPTSQDMFVARFSSDGEVIWTSRPSGEQEAADQATGVLELATGELRVVGWKNDSYTLTVQDIDADGFLQTAWDYATTGGRTKGMDITFSWIPEQLTISGYGYGGTGNGSDIWIFNKHDHGNPTWTYWQHNAGIDAATSAFHDSNLLLFTGYGQESTGSDYDMIAIGSDSNHANEWTHTYGSESEDELCYDAIALGFGEYLLGGRWNAAGGDRGMLVKIDDMGEEIWSRSDYLPAGVAGQFRSLVSTGDRGALCAGWKDITGGRQNWLVRIDANGDSLWAWSFGNSDSCGLYGITASRCGGLIGYGFQRVAGVMKAAYMRIGPDAGVRGTVRNSQGDLMSGVQVSIVGESCTAVTSSSGQFAFAVDPGVTRLAFSGFCIEPDTTDAITVPADSLVSIAITARAPALSSVSSSINIVAQNRIMSYGDFDLHNVGDGALSYTITAEQISPPGGAWLTLEQPQGIIPPGESQEVLVGIRADTTDDGVFDYFGIVHVRSNACPDTLVSIPVFATILDAEKPREVPSDFGIQAVYPNPFNGTTTISFSLPKESEAVIRVFDLAGRTVFEESFGRLSAGEHRRSIRMEFAAAGTYFVRLSSGHLRAVQKIALIK